MAAGLSSTTRKDGDERRDRSATFVPTLRLLHSGTGCVEASTAIQMLEGELVVGRDRESGIAIALPDDRGVSRRHAAFRHDPRSGEVTVVDLGSTNGTLVARRRVASAVLSDGELVRVGDSFLLVRWEPSPAVDAPLPSLVGVSAAIRAVRRALDVAARTSATVVLLGETGTGKEVAARALHEASGRRGPLVAVNCGAIPAELAESYFFGHLAGAFTGARAAQPGVFRAAEGGTLFLDEIGELPAVLQPKLLRAIEERAVVPVGATAPIACDVRLVAATNRDLGRAVEEGGFRADLYARLDEVSVQLPPLRQRREDVLLLFDRALGEPRARLRPDLVEALLLHEWPFNVRELFKVATQLRVYSPGAAELGLAPVADRLAASPAGSARPGSLNASDARPAPSRSPRPPRSPAPTRDELSALMDACAGNVSDVARRAGRSRRQIDRWLSEHGLDAASYRR